MSSCLTRCGNWRIIISTRTERNSVFPNTYLILATTRDAIFSLGCSFLLRFAITHCTTCFRRCPIIIFRRHTLICYKDFRPIHRIGHWTSPVGGRLPLTSFDAGKAKPTGRFLCRKVGPFTASRTPAVAKETIAQASAIGTLTPGVCTFLGMLDFSFLVGHRR